jgi:hypothetical protein
MRIHLAALLIAVAAAVATLASTAVPASVHLVYPGTMDCEQGCNFVAAGWPWPYLVDSHGISVYGSVSLSGGLTGEDIIFPGRMAADFLFWLALASAIAHLVVRLRRRRSSKLSTGQSRGDA